MLIVLIMIIFISNAEFDISSGQAAGESTAGGDDCQILKLLNVSDDAGNEIPYEDGRPVNLNDMSRSTRFRIRVKHIEQYGTELDNIYLSPEDNEFVIRLTIENGTNWKVKCVIDEKGRIYEDETILHLSEDLNAKGERSEEIGFYLLEGEVAVIDIEIEALPSAFVGDEVKVNIVPVQGSAGCPFPLYLGVKIVKEEGFNYPFLISAISVILGLLFAYHLSTSIMKIEPGNESVSNFSGRIRKGALAFLNKEYRYLLFITPVVALSLVICAFLTDFMTYWIVVTFLIGAVFSSVAGNIGMRSSTASNGRAAVGGENRMIEGFRLAFSSGAVMAMAFVSLGLLGICILYLLFDDPNILLGFGFGASLIAYFTRAGGGIYTRSIDLVSESVGKIDGSIKPMDLKIMDGNVGQIAGMGADLYESYVNSIIAAMILGLVGASVSRGSTLSGGYNGDAVLLPIVIAGIGMFASLIGVVIANSFKKSLDLHRIIYTGIIGSAMIHAVASLAVIYSWLGSDYIGIWVAVIAGLAAGIIILMISEYYTSCQFKPSVDLSKATKTGPATNIISGLSLGMVSTVIPVITVCAALVAAFWLVGFYGIALAAVGMLSTLGITMAVSSYGPVAKNAARISEMAKMESHVKEQMKKFNATRNTTAAMGRGFAVGSAVLTALALFSVYVKITHLSIGSISLMEPFVITGMFIGGFMVFLFAALSIKAVRGVALAVEEEIQRQFKEIKGLMKGKRDPDYMECVDVAAGTSLGKIIYPFLYAVVVPVAVGLILGPEALGGLLLGAIALGFLMGIMMANSSSAWNNIKKYVEAGNLEGKGSEAHKASIVGDAVGDTLWNASAPSLNILIKMMSIVSLVFAPLFLLH